MDQKLYLEKLSEVAEWHWEKVKGDTNRNYRAPDDVADLQTPMDIVIDRIKRPPCEHKQSRNGCHWQIYKKPYLKNIVTAKQLHAI